MSLPLTSATGRPRSRTGLHAGRRLLRQPAVLASLVVLACAVVVLVAAPAVAPFPLGGGDLAERLQAPSTAHVFGTDDLGRDMWSQTLYATQTSLAIAAAATLLSAVLGSILGAVAGWFGGRADATISFFIDVQSSIPAFILALGTLAFFGGSPVALVAVLAIEGWERFARIIRGQVMLTKRSGYVAAAVSLGVPPVAVARRHLLPALVGPLAVQLTLAFPAKILMESALSFLGLGLRPPATSLGQLIGIGRDYLASAWWIAAVPAAVLILLSVAVSIVGDRLQDRMIERV